MSERRAEFVTKFGEADADLIEAAAAEHRNPMGMGDERGKGTDAFRWAVLVALSYQCVEKYRESHGLTLTWDAFDAWLREPAQREWLAAHDGDVDFLALFIGTYNPYMPEHAAAEKE